MVKEKTDRGFNLILEKVYPPNGNYSRLVQESSSIGNYDDSWDNPGSSYLWIGDKHVLNREQIKELINELQYWIDNKRLRNDK